MSPLGVIAMLLAAAALASIGTLLLRRRRTKLTAAPRRVVFPFFGESLSQSALDAALRLCQADHAILVPAFLAQVPLSLPLDAPLPRQASQALPLLEAVEQRALSNGVPVDSRIERGRTFRHAMLELVGHERYDRIVAAAAARNGDGFSADDIAWLLDHAPGEIVILRADERPAETRVRRRRPRGRSRTNRGTRLRVSPARTSAPARNR